MRIILLFFMLFGFLLFIQNLIAQPTYSVEFQFRFYNQDHSKVNADSFCKHYRLLGEMDREDQTPCTNEYLSEEGFYNDSSGLFRMPGIVGYSDLIRKFVHDSGDTMLLVLNSAYGEKLTFTIDSLVFRPGSFFVKYEQQDTLHYRQAACDYYNLRLGFLKELMKDSSSYEEWEIYHEVMELKQKYCIKEDDWELKKIEDICSY